MLDMAENNTQNTPSSENRRVEQTNEWYTNKDLFEQMQSLTRDISDIKVVLVETNSNIKKYNGLRDSLEEMENECAKCKEALNSKISENARRIDLEEHKKKNRITGKKNR